MSGTARHPAAKRALPPAILVRGPAELKIATGPGLPLTLLSPPGAGAFAGPGWWRVFIASHSLPPDSAEILDCGISPGAALAALRAGQRLIVLRAQKTVFIDIAGRAAILGAMLLPEAPASLDLRKALASRDLRTSRDVLLGWLASGG
jgi:hypothetical protein